jgi:ribose transport system substrate-binding protein
MLRRQVLIIASAAASLLVAACGSTATSSTSSSSTSSNSASAINLASFKAALAGYEAASPASWEGPTTPVTPPSKIKLGIISCDAELEGCNTPAYAAEAAAKKLGWTYTFYNGQGEASVQNSDLLQALSSGVRGVIMTGTAPTAVQAGLAEAKKLGVPVISASQALSSPNPTYTPPKGQLSFAFDVMNNMSALGDALADWIIVNSNGKAVVQFFLDKEYTSNIVFEDAMQQQLKACTSCTVLPTQYFIASDVTTTLASQTVSVVQDHPNINYIVASYDPALLYQVPALDEAGLRNKVKAVSILGDAPNLAYIREGNIEAADGAYDSVYMGWAAIDQMIRLLDHKAPFQPYGENTPFVLLTNSNLPSASSVYQAEGWTDTQSDYEAKFEALWGLSG